jgi:hypothetical protein
MLDGSVGAWMGGCTREGNGAYLESGKDGTSLAGVSVAEKKGVEDPGLETVTSVPPFGASVKEKSARYLGTRRTLAEVRLTE